MTQCSHDDVVQGRTNLQDCLVVARGMDTVRQQDDVDVSVRVNPERRAGKTRVADGGG